MMRRKNRGTNTRRIMIIDAIKNYKYIKPIKYYKIPEIICYNNLRKKNVKEFRKGNIIDEII